MNSTLEGLAMISLGAGYLFAEVRAPAIAIALIAYTLGACDPKPPPPVPAPILDAGWVFEDAGSMEEAACQNLRRLGCPEGDGVAGGRSCEETFLMEANRVFVNFRPECIAAASSVDQVRACQTVRCRNPRFAP